MKRRRESGVATVLALVALLLMAAVGAALLLDTSYEILTAANFQGGQEGVYAADAALARALEDLRPVADWNMVLDGSMRSGFVDGPPSGVRALANGQSLDLGELRNMANCLKVTACTPSSLTATSALRPWGANNPVWALYAYGPLSNLLPAGGVRSPCYVVVFVADDPSENDNDPLRDGTDQANPGTGRLALRAEAFGPRNSHRIVEATVAREAALARLRILSWREVR